jgi:hypothetical protein
LKKVIFTGLAKGALTGTIIGSFLAVLLDLYAFIQVGHVDLYNFAMFATATIVSSIWVGASIGLLAGIVTAAVRRG